MRADDAITLTRWPWFFDRLVSLGTKYYFRAEVRGLDDIPRGAALLVGNHSATPIIPDTFIKVLVYPGGGWESSRPSRDKIDFHDRHGFVELALRWGVPIIPVVGAGLHDGWHVLTRGDRIAKFFHLKTLMRTDVFPIAFALPTGLVIGPAAPPIHPQIFARTTTLLRR